MPKALIVDDEPTIRFALRRWFERQGWAVDEASDGMQALDRLLRPTTTADADYAVIVCDLRMPLMSGSQLCARLEMERPAVLPRVVFTTGDDAASTAVGLGLGWEHRVLQKPFEFAALRTVVELIAGPM